MNNSDSGLGDQNRHRGGGGPGITSGGPMSRDERMQRSQDVSYYLFY